MGTLRGDNGGERPHEGGGLPDLPPEWGTVIVPDDASELDQEGAPLRRQFRREVRRRRWRRRFHLADTSRRIENDSPGLAVPLLIMSIAVVATLTSLFAVVWPGERRSPTTRPDVAATTVAAVSIGDLALTDAAGGSVRLAGAAPAVVLMVDGCACAELITATARAAGIFRGGAGGSVSSSAAPVNRMSVLVVAITAGTLPALAPDAAPTRALADPNQSLRAAVPGLATAGGGPSVVLLSASGAVIRVLPRVASVEDFRADLIRLT